MTDKSKYKKKVDKVREGMRIELINKCLVNEPISDANLILWMLIKKLKNEVEQWEKSDT